MNNLKTTPFHTFHIDLGAKMTAFAGYEMPLVYSSIKEEHLWVRQKAGVFDVSHMGRFIIEGEEAQVAVQHLISNDVNKLKPGKALYTYLPNEHGGVVDDLLVYQLGSECYMLVVNASNIEKDFEWIQNHNKWKAELKDVTLTTGLLAVQGPRAVEWLQALTDIPLPGIPFYQFKRGTFAGADNVIVSATGYTGSGGFEIYFNNEYAPAVWEALFKLERKLKPIGLAARDTLRLEMGYALYGNELSEVINPLEAGLGWVTDFNTDFIGREALLKSKSQGLKQRLIGFELEGRKIARSGFNVLDENGVTVGRVSSGSISPCLNTGIGLAFVNRGFLKEKNQFFIDVRGKAVKARRVKPPFYKAERSLNES